MRIRIRVGKRIRTNDVRQPPKWRLGGYRGNEIYCKNSVKTGKMQYLTIDTYRIKAFHHGSVKELLLYVVRAALL